MLLASVASNMSISPRPDVNGTLKSSTSPNSINGSPGPPSGTLNVRGLVRVGVPQSVGIAVPNSVQSTVIPGPTGTTLARATVATRTKPKNIIRTNFDIGSSFSSGFPT